MNRSLNEICIPAAPNNPCGSQGDFSLAVDLSDTWAAPSVTNQGEATEININKLLLGKRNN